MLGQYLLILNRSPDRPECQRNDIPRLLGNGDEIAWQDQPSSRMRPSHKCFHTRDFLPAEMHLRLILEEEFFIFDRSGKVTPQLRSIDRRRITRDVTRHCNVLGACVTKCFLSLLEKMHLVAMTVGGGRAELEANHVRFAVKIEWQLERDFDRGQRKVERQPRIAFKGDLGNVTTRDNGSGLRKCPGNSRCDVDNQRVGTRLADVSTQYREVGDLRQDYKPPTPLKN